MSYPSRRVSSPCSTSNPFRKDVVLVPTPISLLLEQHYIQPSPAGSSIDI
ncbi:predicted protein [Botrytis cinerea T4]|uniref:Uncharacterized protein n=1 Tax=Botryotinia fuckeliana (strain T4) TaxID=999810 RepID=G2Y1Q3_BOTF4|nr:predicted protein [Botrytis cinerea T4]